MVNLAKMSQSTKAASKILEEITAARLRATSTTAIIDGMPHAHKAISKIESTAVKIAGLEERYTAMIAQIKQGKVELSRMIDTLEDIDEKGIMRLRYLYGYSPEHIAPAIGLSIRTVFYKLETGKKHLIEHFPEDIQIE